MKAASYSIERFDKKKAPLFFQLIDTNRSRLEDFFAGTIRENNSLEETFQFFEQVELRIAERIFIPFFLVDNETGNFIGLVDVKNIDWSIPKAELGYFIDAQFEGRGVITEAVGKVIQLINAEHHFAKLYCRISSKNLGSRKVAIKNGFDLEGTLRRDYKTSNGELIDLDYYGQLF